MRQNFSIKGRENIWWSEADALQNNFSERLKSLRENQVPFSNYDGAVLENI